MVLDKERMQFSANARLHTSQSSNSAESDRSRFTARHRVRSHSPHSRLQTRLTRRKPKPEPVFGSFPLAHSNQKHGKIPPTPPHLAGSVSRAAPSPSTARPSCRRQRRDEVRARDLLSSAGAEQRRQLAEVRHAHLPGTRCPRLSACGRRRGDGAIRSESLPC